MPQRMTPVCSQATNVIPPQALAPSHSPAFTPSERTLLLARQAGSWRRAEEAMVQLGGTGEGPGNHKQKP